MKTRSSRRRVDAYPLGPSCEWITCPFVRRPSPPVKFPVLCLVCLPTFFVAISMLDSKMDASEEGQRDTMNTNMKPFAPKQVIELQDDDSTDAKSRICSSASGAGDVHEPPASHPPFIPKKRKRLPFIPMPFNSLLVPQALKQPWPTTNVIPNQASSIVHIMGRRVNLSGHQEVYDATENRYTQEIDLAKLVKEWVEDSPYTIPRRLPCADSLRFRPVPRTITIEEEIPRRALMVDAFDEVIDPAEGTMDSIVSPAMAGVATSIVAEPISTNLNSTPAPNPVPTDSPVNALEDMIRRCRKTRAQARKRLRLQKEAVRRGLELKGVFLG